MRIIAVDDDQNVLDILRVILSNDSSVDLEMFSSPQEALRAINGYVRKIDCILLDVMMPEMDGITLCRQIKAKPRHRNTPIIMLTAKSDKDCISIAFAAGATDYICKPFDIHDVMTRIRLADELCSARNEVRALRTRARIEERKCKLRAPCGSGDELGHNCDSHAIEEPKDESVDPVSDAKDCTQRVTRSEITQLFSKDFVKHDELHRSRERKSIG